MTSKKLSKVIIDYFKPNGKILEPCCGTGNFLNCLPTETEWCEIDKGKDFFDYNKNVDWIITNPPYSIYDDFLFKCFNVSNNIVLLVPLTKAFKSKKVDTKIQLYGGLKEVLMIGSG